MGQVVAERRMRTPAELVEMADRALDLLPEDPDTLAQFLRMVGARGLRHDIQECPVAHFLRAMLGAGDAACPPGTDLRVDVGSVTIVLPPGVEFEGDVPDRVDWVGEELFPGPWGRSPRWVMNMTNPGNVRQFIARFDAGEYPDLDQSPPSD